MKTFIISVAALVVGNIIFWFFIHPNWLKLAQPTLAQSPISSQPQQPLPSSNTDSKGSLPQSTQAGTPTGGTLNFFGSFTKILDRDKEATKDNNEFIIWPNANYKINTQESYNILINSDKSISINKKGTVRIDFILPKDFENNWVDIWIYYSYEPVTIKGLFAIGIDWETDGSSSRLYFRDDGLAKLHVCLIRNHHRKGESNYISLHSEFTNVTIQKIIMY
jgi:hypothetical protein